MKKVLVMLLNTALMFPSISAQEIDFSQKTPLNAAIRSAILPGWGQCFNGQKIKGYIIGGLTGLTLCSSVLMYNEAQKTYDKYLTKGVKDDPLYEEYSKQIDQTNILIFLTVSLWTYSVIDAYLVGTKKYGKLTKCEPILKIVCYKNQFRLCVTKYF